jgi:hypothetical protein
MRSPRSTHTVAVGLALAALAPATALASDDLRSPDARDAATASTAASVDLRTPDAHDAADGRSAAGSPSVLVVRMSQPSASAGSGIDWGDMAVGAGGAVLVLALTAGGTLAVQRRRHVSATAPAAV